jgi:hypothetical protein
MHCAITFVTRVTEQKCESALACILAGAGMQRGTHMRQIILFVAGVATGVVISIGTWIGVGAIAPTSALAGSAVDPFTMMTGMKDLPTSHYDDYSVVFIGP